MRQDVQKGVTCEVRIHVGTGEDLKLLPPVPCRVVYIGGKWKSNLSTVTVQLLADTINPGWRSGDSYRAVLHQLRMPTKE